MQDLLRQGDITHGGVFTRHRLAKMRDNARQNGKSVPTWKQLHDCIRPNCETCGVEFSAPGGPRATTPSLQHWPDGRYSMLCCVCNTREGHLKHRADIHLPKTERRCARCERIHPVHDLNRNGNCRPCQRYWNNLYRTRHPERVAASHRAHYERNKDAITANNQARRHADITATRAQERDYQRKRRARRRLDEITRRLQARADEMARQERAQGVAG